MKKQLLLVLATFLYSQAFTQTWVDKMQDPNGNFYDVKADFENYWLQKDNTEKGKGYKVFKRWENFVERRVYPSGNLSLLSQTTKNYNDFLSTYTAPTPGGNKTIGNGNNLTASATFTAMGPFGAMAGNAGGQFLKSGRLNFVTIDPNNSSNLWVGAPAGGLWKSTNGGTTWTTNTDNLGVIGCSDLAIDPTNTSVMYLATGDGDAGDTRSIGVLKSTDAGLTWNTTGLASAVTSNFLIRRLVIDPSNTQIVLAATSSGIYRTVNGGTNWTLVSSGTAYDIEFKPGNSSVIYASGPTFKLSTNGGASFTVISAGIPTTGINRMAIAVTPHDANYVYVLASKSSDSGFEGLYRSTNSGTSFTLMSSSPNLLGWSNAGTDAGGQGWYDLCVAVSPLDKNEVVTGGVNVWRSINGGSTWSIYGHWVGSGAPFTHADHHDLEYDATGTLFNANDGTVYKRVGATWTEISGTMNISQIYRLGLSSLTANKWISGHQDNGTSIWTGTSYNAELGGDGMDCFFDRTNDNNVFGEYQNGSLQRSTNGGISWSSATSGLTGTSPWVTIWKQDPVAATTIYVGRTDLFKSTNLAVSWSTLTAIPASGTIREFAIAPSNNQVIYVLKSSGIFKTINGGTSWTNVTGTVPVGSALPEYICIDPTDPNNAWVVLSGYSSGNKVFMTTNGGTTWTNYSANLPNLPANCCIYQPGTNDRIYVGMDVGIYYRDNSSANWTLYNQGLPNVPISDFEISPASPSLLHVATYGRGVWVASLFSTPSTPVSGFSVSAAPKCEDTSIPFFDQSSNSPTVWSWSVSPSAGVVISSPGSQNPVITFPNGGNYVVSVVASNSLGAGSTYSQVVSITSIPSLVIPNSIQAVCAGSPVTFSVSGASSYSWSNGGGNGPSATFLPNSTTTYTVFAGLSGCSSSTVCSVSLIALPVISINGLSSICSGGSAVLLANGAATYTWNTLATTQIITVSPFTTTSYTVLGKSGAGCVSNATTMVTVNPLPTVSISGPNAICMGSSAQLVATGAFSYTWNTNSMTNAISVSPVFATTYSVLGMDANGCRNSFNKTILVNALPSINLLTPNLIVCSQDQVAISAMGANNYTWLPGGQTTNPLTFVANTSITYTCIGADTNACSNSAQLSFNVNECVGIKNASEAVENLFQLFPNPNSGILTLKSNNSYIDRINLEVFDALGKLVMTEGLSMLQTNNEAMLDITKLTGGVYFVKLTANGKHTFVKLIKED